MADVARKEADKAVYKLKILDKSIKALKEYRNKIITRKLKICDKLDWNTIFISFNFSFFNPVLTIIGVFSKTPQEFPDNKGSQ